MFNNLPKEIEDPEVVFQNPNHFPVVIHRCRYTQHEITHTHVVAPVIKENPTLTAMNCRLPPVFIALGEVGELPSCCDHSTVSVREKNLTK